MRYFAAMRAGAMDPAQKRLKLPAKSIIAYTAANFARMQEVCIAHAAIRTGKLRLRLLPGRSFLFLRLLLLRIAENPFEEIIDGEILVLWLKHEVPIFRCTAFTKIFIDFAFCADLRNMHTGFILFTIIT